MTADVLVGMQLCTADVLVGMQLCTADVLVGMQLCTDDVLVGMQLCTADVLVGMQLCTAGFQPAPVHFDSYQWNPNRTRWIKISNRGYHTTPIETA